MTSIILLPRGEPHRPCLRLSDEGRHDPTPERRPAAPPWIASSGPLSASPPVRVDIPGVRVTAPVGPLGLNRDGTLEVPRVFSRAGWYTGRPTPGEAGPAIIVAHRSSRRGPGAFWHIPAIQPGQEIIVNYRDNVIVFDRMAGQVG